MEHDLKKASPNVKRNRDYGRMVLTSRIRDLLKRYGFRIDMGYGRSQFGLDSDQRGLRSRDGEYEHELAHALMTPEGRRLRDHQETIGPQSTVGVYDTLMDEWASEKLQMMLRRRAGLHPQKSQIPSKDTLYNRIDYALGEDEVDKIITAHTREDYHDLAAERMRALDEGRLTIDPSGRMVPGTSVNAKINERADRVSRGLPPLGKAEAMDEKKKKKNLFWLGRPVFSEGDIPELERAAAKYEFSHGLPRAEAESRAHFDYRKKYHEKAAAYHLSAMNLARQEGSYESSSKHASMVQAHMQALGYSPYDGIPPEIEALARQGMTQKIEFEPHEGDSFLTYADGDGLSKSEPLEKASPNVKRNRAGDDEQKRDRDLISRLGFRIYRGAQDRFGMEADQRAISYNPNTGNRLHEVAHAVLTPPGQTLREYQRALGGPTSKKPPMPQEQRLEEEHTAFAMQPMLERRAGITPFPISPKNHPYVSDEIRRRAREALSAYEEGRVEIDDKGRMVPGTSINGRINQRAYRAAQGQSPFKKTERSLLDLFLTAKVRPSGSDQS